MMEPSKKTLGPANLAGIFLAAAAVVFALEALSDSKGSLLLLVTYWTGFIEGQVALVAAAELSNAKWILPVKRALLSSYYMIALLFILFMGMIFRIGIYPWSAREGVWLEKDFFMARNAVLFVLTFAAAAAFASSSLRGSPERKKRAVLYLLAFVASETLVAFDWIMSLEYPWFSTLFGGFFFVEAVYAGIAVSAVMCAFLLRRPREKLGSMRDAATLLFGFSLFWAGLFYAQFLVIWYGNIPEEAGFVYDRVYRAPYSLPARVVLGSLFVIPFTVLLSRKAKSSRWIVTGVSALVLAGLLLEKIIMIHPAASIDFTLVPPEFACLAVAYWAVLRGRTGGHESAHQAPPEGRNPWGGTSY
jgi:hypothetical protein